MNTESKKKEAFQFFRLEGYSHGKPFKRAGNGRKVSEKQRRLSVTEVLDEACRVVGASTHVKSPLPPKWLLGSRKIVEEAGRVWMSSTRYGKRKIRSDSPWLGGGVSSLPNEMFDMWPDFRDTCIDFLKAKHGERLLAVVEHLDEEHPHIHYYVVPKPGEHFGMVHPGFAAQDAERRRKVGPGEIRKPVSAYKGAMRKLQDEFFEKVAGLFGLARVGANTGRKSRAEWKLQRATDDAERSIQRARDLEQKIEIETSRLLEMTMRLSIESSNLTATEDQLKKRRAELSELEQQIERRQLGLESAIGKIEELSQRLSEVESAIHRHQFEVAQQALATVKVPIINLESEANAARLMLSIIRKIRPK